MTAPYSHSDTWPTCILSLVDIATDWTIAALEGVKYVRGVVRRWGK